MKAQAETRHAHKAFADFLKEARDTLWISQATMAKFLRVPLRRYQHWEAREAMPRDDEPAIVRAKVAALLAAAKTPWNSGL